MSGKEEVPLIIRTKRKADSSVRLNKTFATDKRLSYKSRGIMVHLLCQPNNRAINVNDLIAMSERDGRDAIRTGLGELEKAGYIKRLPIQDANGHFQGWEILLFETPTETKEWVEKVRKPKKKPPQKPLKPLKVTKDSTNYREFLRSDYWKDVRSQVLRRDSNVCQQCGEAKRLQVHHLTYEHHGDEANHLGDLITLCTACHTKEHERGKKK